MQGRQVGYKGIKQSIEVKQCEVKESQESNREEKEKRGRGDDSNNKHEYNINSKNHIIISERESDKVERDRK